MDPSVSKSKQQRLGKKKGAPEMTATNKEVLQKSLHGRGGLSMDIGGSPYLLPPEIQNSRESLHSLSRSLGHEKHDPYRPATLYENGSAPPSIRADNASIRTSSTARTGGRGGKDAMNQNLLRNAQRMSTSGPPPPINELPDAAAEPQRPQPALVARKNIPSPPQQSSNLVELDATKRVASPANDISDVRKSNNYLAGFIHSREASIDGSSRGQSPDPPHAMSPPPRGQSLKLPTIPAISIEQEFPGANLTEYSEIVVPPSPDAASRARGGTSRSPGLSSPDVDVTTPFYTPTENPENPMNQGLGVSDIDFGASKRLSILRPLPPDDPTDNAEQRANRIRSFYKEYFSDGEAHAYQAGANYYEDYGSEFMGDATVFDPASGQFVVAQAPFAEPVTRRAMTPPPRGPPRRFIGPSHGSRSSNPGSMPPRGRAFSSASTSRVGPGGHSPPKRLLPPKALRTLPTPHLLKEDAFVLPIDFAPPSGYKGRAAGRPDSPFMESRPYSPAVPIASPLASAFNDLPTMPSPHLLRKSGTFTALDFAPPPKFRNDGSGSDAGSIRSGRSGHSTRSAAQVQNIRAGTYRISRIPTELVGSKREFEQSLRPQWKLGN